MSPDLNIIENIWAYIGNVINSGEVLPRTVEELRITVHNIWQAMTQARIRRLVSSCRRRVIAVINAKGVPLRIERIMISKTDNATDDSMDIIL